MVVWEPPGHYRAAHVTGFCGGLLGSRHRVRDCLSPTSFSHKQQKEGSAMPEMSAYGDGVPSWIDMASPDVEASKAFYTALFGWQANPVPVPDAGGYTLFTLDGKQVAGVGAIMSSDQPPAWMTYINVSDADGVAKKVGDAGGSVLMAPMDIIHQGRMAVFADTAGAVLGLWQPAEHMGAQLVNEPGAYSW